MRSRLFHYTQGRRGVERLSDSAAAKKILAKIKRRSTYVLRRWLVYADRCRCNDACRGRDKFAAGARSFAPDRAASLPTAKAIQRCAEWRRAPETWSWGSPWTGRSGRCKSPRWDRACASRSIRLLERYV